MVFKQPTFGTSTTYGEQFIPERKPLTAKEQCKRDGGYWDEQKQVCLLVRPSDTAERPPEVEATGIETITDDKGNVIGATVGGKTYYGLNSDDIQLLRQQQQEKKGKLAGTAPLGTAQKLADAQFRARQLAGGVGQFGEMGISPTGLDVGESLTAGVVGALPRALSLAAGGAAIGFGVGAVPGVTAPVTAPAGAAIGAIIGFVGGLTSSMISNFKSQRSDTTTAQQRILDEGKQTMKDWATLAKNDPANKSFYLAEYNKQSAQINQAYRQMKLDTSRDVARFETALPNLAEFEAFYSTGGERDTLNIEMRNALVAPPTEDYEMLELAYRFKDVVPSALSETQTELPPTQLPGVQEQAKVEGDKEKFFDKFNLESYTTETIKMGTLPFGPGSTVKKGLTIPQYIKKLPEKYRNLARQVTNMKATRGKTADEVGDMIDFAIAGNDEVGDLIGLTNAIKRTGHLGPFRDILRRVYIWGGQQPFL